MITEEIKKLCRENYDRIVELRHHFHMYPELDYEEVETAGIVAEELKKLGIETLEGVDKTGVVGLIKGKYPGKTIMLRADMDALPIQEEADVPYKSVVPGKMHACGHDGHTASLIGTAMILSGLKDRLHGNVKLIFQPAEEYGDAPATMIKEGYLDDVDAALGLHFWGPVPKGQISLKSGPIMAAPDAFRFRVIGKGGHGSTPHLCVDPIMITVQVINAMQSIISRRKNTFDPAVISVCTINGGDEYNIIPGSVEVKGTIRTFSEELRNWIPGQIENLLKGITEAQGAAYEFLLSPSIPPLNNDAKITNIIRNASAKILGEENVITLERPDLGGEDFAIFAAKVPSCFFFVGISSDMENPSVHHSPGFVLDDECLYTASAALAQAAFDYLNE